MPGINDAVSNSVADLMVIRTQHTVPEFDVDGVGRHLEGQGDRHVHAGDGLTRERTLRIIAECHDLADIQRTRYKIDDPIAQAMPTPLSSSDVS